MQKDKGRVAVRAPWPPAKQSYKVYAIVFSFLYKWENNGID